MAASQSHNTPATARKPAGKLRNVVSILVMVVGVLVLFYPFIAQKINTRQEVSVVSTYDKAQHDMDQAKRDKLLADAADYNEQIRTGQTPISGLDEDLYTKDSFYLKQLDVDGIMGSVEIPKISVKLPIRHGTTEQSLGNGVGHLYGTSLPIGGKATNAVLAAHRGLPNAELFTRLDELSIGDVFYIHVLNKKLAYQVDAIWTVEPGDVSHFTIDPDQDYVTLLTCTPYGVNTQRLLVRGHRIPLTTAPVQHDHGLYPDMYILLLAAAVIVIIAVVVIVRVRRSHADKAKQKAQE